MVTYEQLKALGLDRAAEVLRVREERVVTWADAYARFSYVTPEQMEAFREQCAKERHGLRSKRLLLVRLEAYAGVPPTDVLEKLAEARTLGLFAEFWVASIDWVETVPDPILFGKVAGCPDFFFIAQWGDDINVEELLAMPTKEA